RDRARGDHVVEEPEARIVEQRRTDAELRSRKQIEHRGPQQVSGRAADHAQSLERVRPDRLDLDGAAALVPQLQRDPQVDLAAVALRRDAPADGAATELLEGFTHGGARADVSRPHPIDVDPKLFNGSLLPRHKRPAITVWRSRAS